MGGLISMKTKIIYISGNEVFDMADIRAAFEEVRNTLGLGRDTIMFGVPVDNDDALVGKTDNTNVTDTVEQNLQNTEFVSEPEPVQIATDLKKEVSEPVATPTTRKTRVTAQNKKSKDAPAPIQQDDITPQKQDESEKIIPILSILAAQKEATEPETSVASDTSDTDAAPDDAEEHVTEIADIDISAEIDTNANIPDDAHTEIADMITDDAPDAPIEKTLEQLLENITPLREDSVEDVVTSDTDTPDDEITTDVTFDDVDNSDTDATLEQLAAEFAENQDKIPTPTKSENHSKIGKLKNILPFKKVKRDDSGLMGDLFGWAGIAANDDDFSIPGFFTNAASKK